MGDEINRELFLDPSLIDDEESTSPLLDQAVKNVEEQTIDNLEQDRARKAALQRQPRAREVDGIVFSSGPEPEAEKK